MAARAAHDLAIDVEPWLTELAVRASAVFVERPERSEVRLDTEIRGGLEGARNGRSGAQIIEWIESPPTTTEAGAWFGPAASRSMEMGARRWPVPEIATPLQLATFLNVDLAYLEWYADVRSMERTASEENLRHYNYHWRTKRSGGARLVEAPKQNLKHLQRRVLRLLLDNIPPHEAAHGFRRGRSIQTFAAPHTAKHVVLRLDLRTFFASVPVGRVFQTFRAAGYPEAVAHLLTGLVTNTAPGSVLSAYPGHRGLDATTAAMLRGPHLPQGAPTSPALANLAAFGLDVRLAALARSFDATYTRYADDLAVSGDDTFRRDGKRFLALARQIVGEEGFVVHSRKTRSQGQHQRQVLTGLTVNRHLNLDRRELDQLRAQLHDASLNGPTTANRMGHPHFRAHLEGRIGFVQATNPVRARKLWRVFDQITW